MKKVLSIGCSVLVLTGLGFSQELTGNEIIQKVNDTINNILDLAGRDKVMFYGVTIAGPAGILNLKRISCSPNSVVYVL